MAGQRVVIFGNAGSGKTTLAGQMAAEGGHAVLSLDAIAFGEGTQRRPETDCVADLQHFIALNDRWIVEGCYATLAEAALRHADGLIFLNPGVGVCLERCRKRAWEPDKFSSKVEHDTALAFLLDWVAGYASRDDEYGLAAHRRVFEAFGGPKREIGAEGSQPE